MSQSDPEFVPRFPRHDAVNAKPSSVEVWLAERNQLHAVQLVNLSRRGIGVRAPVELAPDQVVTLKFTDSDGLDVSLGAVVRWCSVHEPAVWDVGCEFDSEVEWETLGELFLRGVLETE